MENFQLGPSIAPTRGSLKFLSVGYDLEVLGCNEGKHFRVEFSLDQLKKGGGISRIGVTCVKKRGKPPTTYFCFVARLECCGVLSTPFSACSGFCIPQL